MTIISTVAKMQFSQQSIMRRLQERERHGLSASASDTLCKLETQLIEMQETSDNSPRCNNTKLLMDKETKRIQRKKKNWKERSKNKIKIGLITKNRDFIEKICVGATLGNLYFKKETNTLTQKENVKLNRIQLYTDIYWHIFGMVDGDEWKWPIRIIVYCVLFVFTLLVLPSLY